MQVIPEITLADLCKSVHDVIIILVLNDPLRIKDAEKKEKNYKNLNISRMERAFSTK